MLEKLHSIDSENLDIEEGPVLAGDRHLPRRRKYNRWGTRKGVSSRGRAGEMRVRREAAEANLN